MAGRIRAVSRHRASDGQSCGFVIYDAASSSMPEKGRYGKSPDWAVTLATA